LSHLTNDVEAENNQVSNELNVEVAELQPEVKEEDFESSTVSNIVVTPPELVEPTSPFQLLL